MDRELVERAQRGDEIAFSTLAMRIADRLYATAHHILRETDEADDAAQRAMIEIWRELPRLKDPDRFEAWAYRIVVRAAYAESKRHRRWRLPGSSLGWARPPADGSPAVAFPDPADRGRHYSEHIADRDELGRGLLRLPVEHRAAIVLKHFVGLSNEEIAEVLEIPEGTVRSRLHYALRHLRTALEADARPINPREAADEI